MTNVATTSTPVVPSTPTSEVKATPETNIFTPDKSSSIHFEEERPSKRKVDNREMMISDDIKLFEAWFEVMDTNKYDKVNVDELSDKVAASGLFTFNSQSTKMARKLEEKTVKDDILDLIEQDLSLNVCESISIDQFFKVIVRFPRYLYRLKRAAGDTSSPPKVWEKPEPLNFREDDDDLDAGILDPFDVPEEDEAPDKELQRITWRNSFKDMFKKSNFIPLRKKKKNPKRLSKQSSSFYERCCSVRRAIMGKKSSVKVFATNDTEEVSDEMDFVPNSQNNSINKGEFKW